MDNDVLRRGKPTVHVRFGQAQAMLAGDAMQALAFELLTPLDETEIPPALQARLVALLARGAGHSGMAGGQAIDLASVGRALNEAELRRMHELKTGALLQASVDMGAACGSATGATRDALRRYGHAIGLAFQVVDDILDFTGDDQQLGKPAASDLASGYLTAPALYALEERPVLAGLIEREFCNDGDLEQALELVRSCEAIPRSRELAEGFARDAGDALSWLPVSDASRALRALPDFVLSRLY